MYSGSRRLLKGSPSTLTVWPRMGSTRRPSSSSKRNHRCRRATPSTGTHRSLVRSVPSVPSRGTGNACPRLSASPPSMTTISPTKPASGSSFKRFLACRLSRRYQRKLRQTMIAISSKNQYRAA